MIKIDLKGLLTNIRKISSFLNLYRCNFEHVFHFLLLSVTDVETPLLKKFHVIHEK